MDMPETESVLRELADALTARFPTMPVEVDGRQLSFKLSTAHRRRGYDIDVPVEEHVKGQRQLTDFLAVADKPADDFFKAGKGNLAQSIGVGGPDGREITVRLVPNHYSLTHNSVDELVEALVPLFETAAPLAVKEQGAHATRAERRQAARTAIAVPGGSGPS